VDVKKMKKFLIGIGTLLFVGGFIFLIIYGAKTVLEKLDLKSQIEQLEKYEMKKDEIIIKNFNTKKKEYAVSKYNDDTSSWSHFNILLKYEDVYYFLKNVQKCDSNDEGSNMFFYKDSLYVHCIGKKGNINRYTIDGINIKEDVIKLKYEKVPNISQVHILIDDVDDDYIYLSSSVKVNDNVADGNKIKCDLESKVCEYN
jgi:hypothetical protein